jgi:hypothetical protein
MVIGKGDVTTHKAKWETTNANQEKLTVSRIITTLSDIFSDNKVKG